MFLFPLNDHNFSPSQVNGQLAFSSSSPDSGYAASALQIGSSHSRQKIRCLSASMCPASTGASNSGVTEAYLLLEGELRLKDLVHSSLLSPKFPLPENSKTWGL